MKSLWYASSFKIQNYHPQSSIKLPHPTAQAATTSRVATAKADQSLFKLLRRHLLHLPNQKSINKSAEGL